MHDRGSRYRAVAETTSSDAAGRRVPATGLRVPDRPAGVVTHLVTSDDRLDRLAGRYYGKPRKWWRIVDANAEVLSPLALLGQETVVTHRTLIYQGPAKDEWYRLPDAVRALTGVEDAVLVPAETTATGIAEAELVVRLNTAGRTTTADVVRVVGELAVCGPLVADRRTGTVITIPTEGRT